MHLKEYTHVCIKKISYEIKFSFLLSFFFPFFFFIFQDLILKKRFDFEKKRKYHILHASASMIFWHIFYRSNEMFSVYFKAIQDTYSNKLDTRLQKFFLSL